MILHAIAPRTRLAADVCGHTPQLIEARGRVQVDPRLIGQPARQYHVECAHCGLATAPVYSPRSAEAIWNLSRTREDLVDVADLPALRLKAERGLANGLLRGAA